MLCACWQVIGQVGILVKHIDQFLLLMILDTHHKQRVIFKALLYQVIVLALVFKLAVHPFVTLLL